MSAAKTNNTSHRRARSRKKATLERQSKPIEVQISELESLRMCESGARVETAQAQVELAKSQLAHAQTRLSGAQTRYNQILEKMQTKGPDKHQLTSLNSDKHMLLFQPL